MAADVVQFPHKTPPISPLAQFIRLGETSYRRHASLWKGVNLEKLMERMNNHSKNLQRQSNALAVLNDQFREQGVSVRPIQRLSRLEARARGEQS